MTQQLNPPKGIFATYMKHYRQTPEEQLEKNKPLLKKLKKWIEESKIEKISEEEAQARKEHWEEVKQIIDSFRPEGHKLYTEE